MASPFVHLEVLGPRASLDAWLAVLQDHGGCHFADALATLEGEAGIGRPAVGREESEALALRREAAHALRAVERILPAVPPGTGPGDWPAWTVGPRGEGQADVEDLHAEAVAGGDRLREALEAARAAEHEAEGAGHLQLAVIAHEGLGATECDGRAWVLSSARAARRLAKRLRRAGLEAAAASPVVVARGDATLAARCADEAPSVARPLDLVAAGLPPSLSAARRAADEMAATARRLFEERIAALRRRLDEDGPRARVLLDALEDAEARGDLHRVLAATEHVVAARVFVRREDEPDLRRRLSVAFGREVVVRALADAPDTPALPRAVAGLPLGTLAGLEPRRFGEVSTPALLAVAMPLAVGATAADAGTGLLLLVVGAVLAAGAAVGSPRRDTGLLAQLGGLVAFLLGLVDGRAFGEAGRVWFGSGWGLLDTGGVLTFVEAGPFRGLVLRLGGVALLLALWGVVCVLGNLWRERGARVRGALVGTLTPLVLVGSAALALPEGGLRWLWLAAPLAAVGILLVSGPRQGLGRLVLDLVATVRLVAVGLLALVLFEWGYRALADPDLLRLLLAPPALVVSALAVAVDPALMAMGVPYDLSLGAGALAQPFSPFTRRVRGRARS